MEEEPSPPGRLNLWPGARSEGQGERAVITREVTTQAVDLRSGAPPGRWTEDQEQKASARALQEQSAQESQKHKGKAQGGMKSQHCTVSSPVAGSKK